MESNGPVCVIPPDFELKPCHLLVTMEKPFQLAGSEKLKPYFAFLYVMEFAVSEGVGVEDAVGDAEGVAVAGGVVTLLPGVFWLEHPATRIKIDPATIHVAVFLVNLLFIKISKR